jgi:hypothetical protein
MNKELEEASKNYIKFPLNIDIDEEQRYFNSNLKSYDAFIAGAKWQAERMYSEEDLKEALYYALSVNKTDGIIITTDSQIVRDAIKFIKQDKI